MTTDNQLITIEGLKGVGNVELNLMPNQRVYTFIGSNGVGKTKVLEALFQLKFLSHLEVREYMKDSPLPNESFVLSGAEGFAAGLEFFPLVDGGYHASLNDYESANHSTPVVMIGTNSRIITGEIKNYKLPSFEKRKGIYIKQVIDAIINEKMPNLGAIEDLASWFVSRAESDSKWQAEEDNRGFEITVLLKILNEIDASIDPSYMMKYGEDDIRIKIKKNKDELETKLSELSSGFVSLVRIVQAIINGYSNFTNEINLTHVKGVVFIDEIESHLHLEWQVKIIPLLKDIFRNTTFYIATHSPLILTQLQQGEAYRLVCGTDKVVRSELIEQPSKQEFSDVLDEGFEINLNHLKIKAIQDRIKDKPQKSLDDLLAEWDRLDSEGEGQ